MFFSGNVEDTRQLFYTSWHKYRAKEPLLPLEQQLVNVINDHPEYHALFNDKQVSNEQYSPDIGQNNPFLHMGLHLAIREQITTNRPIGISTIHKKLLKKSHHPLDAEHAMMECLAQLLWQAQATQQEPNEQAYLQALNRLC